MAEGADFFLRTPTLTASNFEAFWSTDPRFLSSKDLNPFLIGSKFQETSNLTMSVSVFYLQMQPMFSSWGRVAVFQRVANRCRPSWSKQVLQMFPWKDKTIPTQKVVLPYYKQWGESWVFHFLPTEFPFFGIQRESSEIGWQWMVLTCIGSIQDHDLWHHHHLWLGCLYNWSEGIQVQESQISN